MTYTIDLSALLPSDVEGQLSHNLNTIEFRLLCASIAFLQPQQNKGGQYIIPVKDMADLIGIQAKDFYHAIDQTVISLHRKYLEIRPPGEIRRITWIQQSRVNMDQKTIEFKLANYIAERIPYDNSLIGIHLLDAIKKEFIENVDMISIGSTYSIIEKKADLVTFNSTQALLKEEMSNIFNEEVLNFRESARAQLEMYNVTNEDIMKLLRDYTAHYIMSIISQLKQNGLLDVADAPASLILEMIEKDSSPISDTNQKRSRRKR